MADNPFTKDQYAHPTAKDGALGFDPTPLVEIATWIATAMASGLLGNAFTQYVNQLRNRSGQGKVEELKTEVLKAMKRVKKKPAVSDHDLKLRVDEIFKDREL